MSTSSNEGVTIMKLRSLENSDTKLFLEFGVNF
jgi:hypothetical protein